jgi:ribosomal RNA-processing protein 12
MASSELENALAKIRPHASSSLLHQKTPATLLRALEATFDEQHTNRSPTAYFASLLTTLDGTLHRDQGSGVQSQLGEGDVLPAVLYLLALVAPFVPAPVIRAHLNTLNTLVVPLWPSLYSHAPPLRSQLTLFGSVLKVLDRTQLEIPAVRQSFASILQLCVDARPKVRRKAGEVVRELLEAPPPPMIKHPYADRAAEWAKNALDAANANPLAKAKGKKDEGDGPETAVHLLAFLRPVLPKLPPGVCF